MGVSQNFLACYWRGWGEALVVYHFKKIPVSLVGKFRMGRIVYHLQKILIMENVFHFFTQSASGAWLWELKLLITWNWCEERSTCKWNKGCLPVPVSSVGKFRMGRIVYINKRIRSWRTSFISSQSASVAPGREN